MRIYGLPHTCMLHNSDPRGNLLWASKMQPLFPMFVHWTLLLLPAQQWLLQVPSPPLTFTEPREAHAWIPGAMPNSSIASSQQVA